MEQRKPDCTPDNQCNACEHVYNEDYDYEYVVYVERDGNYKCTNCGGVFDPQDC